MQASLQFLLLLRCLVIFGMIFENKTRKKWWKLVWRWKTLSYDSYTVENERNGAMRMEDGGEKKQRWGSLSFVFVASLLLFPSVCELMKSILLFFTSTRRRTRLRFSFNALRHSQWRFSFAPLHFFIFIDSCCWDEVLFSFPEIRWMEEEKKIIFRIQFQSWYAWEKITADKKLLMMKWRKDVVDENGWNPFLCFRASTSTDEEYR